MTKITLKSNDGQVSVEVERSIAEKSKVIREMLEFTADTNEGGDETISDIPNLQVSGDILQKVVDWITYHKDDPVQAEDKTEEPGTRKKPELSKWDKDFLQVERSVLFDLILAANYLEIKGLLDITCSAVSDMIQGKSAEEIRKEFNIVNDLNEQTEETTIEN